MRLTSQGGLLASTAIILMFAAAQAANAQSAPEAPAYGEDIIVTAQKRAQNLNDVGITITAASAQTLQSRGVINIDQMAQISPGFSVGINYTGQQFFSLRGINFNTAQISASPTVSTYVDEAILPYAIMTGAMLLDVERVEVLKGPQGTLFGQNATAGSVNVIAAKPTATLQAGLRSEVNNFGQVFLEGYVSGPLSETLRARVAASTTQFGAWQRGYYLTDGRNGDENKGAVRLLLDWTPTDALTVAINLNASFDKSDTQHYQIGSRAPLVPAAAFPGLDVYPLPNDARDAEWTPGIKWGRNDSLYQGVLRIDYELSDALTFTSMTNYSHYEEDRLIDGDAVQFNSLYYNPNGHISSFSQEFRLSGRAIDERLNYIVGVNYQKDRILDANDLFTPGYSGTPYGTNFKTPSRLTNESKGIFGNFDFEIIDGLTFTAGARYTDTRQTATGCSTANALGTFVANLIYGGIRLVNGLPADPNPILEGQCITVLDAPLTPGGQPPFVPGSVDLRQSEDNVSWRVGLNYKIAPDNLIYGLVSRGYKSGGYPVSPADLVASSKVAFSQEELTAYELGAKLSFLDRRINLSFAGFYYDYKNKQFLTYEPVPVVGYNQVIANIPKSRAKGFEVDTTLYPIAGLTLRGAVTYVETRVGDFPTFNAQVQPINVKGNPFSYAPKWSGTMDAEYRFPVSADIDAYIGGSMLFNSRTYSDLGKDPLTDIPSYQTFDARIGLASEKGWTAGLFVRNLTDEYYWTSVFRSSDVFAQVAGRPRTFGGTVSFRF